MIEPNLIMSGPDLIKLYLTNPSKIMWFLGAGTSRSANLPTAYDIIWDLKRKYYCLNENQKLPQHDIHNNAIKRKIQLFLDSKNFPNENSPEEYSFYFNLLFNNDLSMQQKYLDEALGSDKISLNIGHRVFAALIEMEKIRVVFTTNFDEVIETACSDVCGKNLSYYHLEGSYAALDALNAGRFPLYCKIHGDFRYQNVKNLPESLLTNDQEIRKCFLASSVSNGLIVSGYSGRDNNVMAMLQDAVEQNNAFPHGIFWTVPRLSDASNTVYSFLKYAQSKGIRAKLVETGTFDELMLRIWRQTNGIPKDLEENVHPAVAKKVSIPLPKPGNNFPILRTNALPIIKVPNQCGVVNLKNHISFRELKDKFENSSKIVLTKTDKVLFWGDKSEIVNCIASDEIASITSYELHDLPSKIAESTYYKSFLAEAISRALCCDKPLLLKRWRFTYYLIADFNQQSNYTFTGLRKLLGQYNNPGPISGMVPNQKQVFWAEAVSLRLEERYQKLWLLVEPTIWIDPPEKRHDARDFLRKKRQTRYNSKSYFLLDAWIEILLGKVGSGETAGVSCFTASDYCAEFEISTRTAYSRRG